MPQNIVLRELTNPPKKGNSPPIIATRADLRDGARGSGVGSGYAPGVSGSVADGQVVTISAQSGYDFGAGEHRVELFDDMRNGVAGQRQQDADLAAGAGWYKSRTSGANGGVYSSLYAHSKGVSIKQFDEAGGELYITRSELSGQVTDILTSFWVFIPEGTSWPGMIADGYSPGGSNWKLFWLAADEDSFGNGDGADICVPTNNASAQLTLSGNETSMNSAAQWYGYGQVPNVHTYGEWLWCCVLLDSTRGAQRVLHLSKSKGLKRFEREGINIFGATTKPYFSVANYPGWIREGVSDESEIYYDDIQVVAGSAAGGLVLIGDAPELQNCTEIAVQRVINRTSTEIQFEVQQGPFNTLAGKYIFVLDPTMLPVPYEGANGREIY